MNKRDWDELWLDEEQIDQEWKDQWKERLGNSSTKREARKEKAADKRRIHKKNRKAIKYKLRILDLEE